MGVPPTMIALTFNQASGSLQLRRDYPTPEPGDGEALVQVIVAQVCSTDLEIVRGYVPGFNHVLGHEFVGRVVRCDSVPSLVGQRVVAEINCNDAKFTCADAIFQRNHAPGRTVLGIINRDGCMAEYVTLPAVNLHVVPEELRDSEAAFAEPLAAAARIVEQGLPATGSNVAVIGDGKLGLLVAAVLSTVAQERGCRVTLLGRHEEKMRLVSGLTSTVLLSSSGAAVPGGSLESDALAALEGTFDLVVEASGSSDGVRNALRLCRAMGQVLLKSTVSVAGCGVLWAEVANDVVVNEKALLGSRCGPTDVALRMLVEHPALRSQIKAMVSGTYSLEEGDQAIKEAGRKGVLKVQLRTGAGMMA